MSQRWTLANVFARRARERAGRAPTVAGSHSRTHHAHGAVPVPGHAARCTAGATARSVSPRGLLRTADASGVGGGAGPVPPRGTQHGSYSRRGQSLLVTRQLENLLRARPVADRDVGITATPGDVPGELRRDCARVESVEGAVITGGELAELAPAAVAADSEDPDPVTHTHDAFPTTGRGKAARRERGRARSRPTTLP